MDYFYFSDLNDPNSFVPVKRAELYRVCWAAYVYDDDGENPEFRTHYSPDIVSLEEAERRVAWGKETYPQIIYWIQRA